MIAILLSKVNMSQAYHQVFKNKGSAGIDGMRVVDLKLHLSNTWDFTKNLIATGNYIPSAIKGVSIPKSNGKERLLGIPTVQDRLIQQGLYQVLMPLFDPYFEPFSYGFRPQKSAHQAIKQAQQYIC